MSYSIIDYLAKDIDESIILTDEDRRRIYKDITTVNNVLTMIINRLNSIKIKIVSDESIIKNCQLEGINQNLINSLILFADDVIKHSASNDNVDHERDCPKNTELKIEVKSPLIMDSVLTIVDRFLNGNIL